MSTELPPFLPEPEPITPPRAQSRGARWKTLVVWVLLMMMFLAIWQFLNPGDGHVPAKSAAAPASGQPWAWSSALPGLLFVAAVAAFALWFRRAVHVGHGFYVALEPGRVALAEGRAADAAAAFSRVAATHAKQAGYEAIALMNVADAELHAGRIDEAIAIYVRMERARRLSFSSGPRAGGASQLAFLYALAGELEAAERWVKATRERLAKTQDDRFVVGAWACVAEAVLALRRGDPAACIAKLDARWLLLRGALLANSMRAVEVVRALAESAGGVRASNTMAERLLRVEPVVRGELAYLGQRWPEMEAFLAAHGLGPSRVA